jgi:hypothetical protein
LPHRPGHGAVGPEGRSVAAPPAVSGLTGRPAAAEGLDRLAPLIDAWIECRGRKSIYESDKSLSGFFTNLFEALRNLDAIDALERLEAKHTRKQRWGWLAKYLKIEPGFRGLQGGREQDSGRHYCMMSAVVSEPAALLSPPTLRANA